MTSANHIDDDLSNEGRALLKIIVTGIKSKRFRPGQPETFLGYKECCDGLGLTKPGMDVHWGRFLQQHGLNDLNDWTIRQDLPRVSGLIVHQHGDRQYWPGGDYFGSNGRTDRDFDWWDEQVKRALQFDWSKVR